MWKCSSKFNSQAFFYPSNKSKMYCKCDVCPKKLMVGFHKKTKIEHIFPLTLFVYDDDYLWLWSQYDIFIISIFNKKERANCMLTSPSRHKHNRGGSWTMNIWYLAENYDWLKGTRGLLYPSPSHTLTLTLTHTLSLSLTHIHTRTLSL